MDDYTFVVETSRRDERSRLDLVGHPHSGDLRVEERFHRVNLDRFEWTVLAIPLATNTPNSSPQLQISQPERDERPGPLAFTISFLERI